MGPLCVRSVALLAALAFVSLTSAQRPEKPAVPEPKLPVIDFKACGSGGYGANPQGKIAREQRVFSSWEAWRAPLGILHPGDKYTLTGGVNIIHEPDQAVVRNSLSQAAFLKPGDAVLGYGYDADGTTAFWAQGVWFKEDDEHISTMGADCGFADKTQCTIEITKRGVKEWWVQVQTAGGVKAWLLGATFERDKLWHSGNFGQMCRD